MRRFLGLTALIGALAISTPAPAFAAAGEYEPFGVRMGMSKAELVKALNLKPDDIISEHANVFVARKAITPNPTFTAYSYHFTEETGVCKVVGMTTPTGDSVKLMKDYDYVLGLLRDKYGEPHMSFNKTYDGAKSLPAIVNLHNDDLVVSSIWGSKEARDKNGKFDTADVKMPGDLSAVLLEPTTSDGRLGLVTAAYAFKNEIRCHQIIRAGEARGL